MKCCEINTGAFRIPVTLAHVTKVPDAFGGWTETETTYATPLGAAKALTLAQRVRMGLTDERKVLQVVLRYRTDTVEKDIATVDGVKYTIIGLDNVEFANRFTRLTLQEVPH